jgi:hypothetical protein
VTTPHTRELSVDYRQDLIGTIKVGIRGDAVAYDFWGKRLGSFRSVPAAAGAFK